MQRLPDSELDIMLALWEAENDKVNRAYFDQKLKHRDWSANALNSFLTRLEDKGFIQSSKEGKSKYYRAVVPRDQYVSREGKSILRKLYNNSLKSFVLSISDSQDLDAREIDELQQYLDELKEAKGHDR